MSEYKHHIESPIHRFITNHPVFDDIVHLNYGTSVLMLDETFSEAYKLLHLLFQTYGLKTVGKHYELLANSSLSTISHPENEIINVGDKGLSDISIELNELRKKFPSSPFIHMGLPDMLMQNTQDDILRLLNSWQKNIRQNKTIEFYILPRGTFNEFEKKILAIVDGAIEIRVDHHEGRFKSYFKPIRSCAAENHLKEFRYKVEENRLLIQRGDIFSDILDKSDVEEINHRVQDYKDNLRFQKIILGEKQQIETSVYDYWMLSQIQGHHLVDLKTLFPENFDRVLQKIAAWQITDVVRVVKTSEIRNNDKISSSTISLSTKLALALPIRLTSILLRFRTTKTRMIPLDAYLSNRKGTLAFIDMLLTKLDANDEDYMERLLEMQKRFSELGARETSIKRTKQLGENSSIHLDIKHFEKIIALTFQSGYGSIPKINKISDTEFEIIVTNCWACSEINYTKPVCTSIAGTIEGICGTIFKKLAKCTELECKAMGDPECVFKIIIE